MWKNLTEIGSRKRSWQKAGSRHQQWNNHNPISTILTTRVWENYRNEEIRSCTLKWNQTRILWSKRRTSKTITIEWEGKKKNAQFRWETITVCDLLSLWPQDERNSPSRECVSKVSVCGNQCDVLGRLPTLLHRCAGSHSSQAIDMTATI